MYSVAPDTLTDPLFESLPMNCQHYAVPTTLTASSLHDLACFYEPKTALEFRPSLQLNSCHHVVRLTKPHQLTNRD